MKFSAHESDFDRRIKNLDERLYLLWNPNVNRWEIHRLSQIVGDHLILRIQTDKGEFRPPIEEDIGALIKMDWMGKSSKDLTKFIDEHNMKLEEKRKEKIHDLNKEYGGFLRKQIQKL